MVGTNRQARAEATRTHLLLAAREVFAEKGYSGATVAAITRKADTAHGTFYLYFKNKEAVFVHVISDVLEELYQHAFTPIEDLPDRFDPGASRDRIAAFFEAFLRHGPLWRAVLEGALASAVVEQHWMEQRARLIGALAQRWALFQERGGLRTFDTEITAAALASMLEWFAFTGTVFGQTPGFPVPASADGDAATPAAVDAHIIDALADIWTRVVAAER